MIDESMIQIGIDIQSTLTSLNPIPRDQERSMDWFN